MKFIMLTALLLITSQSLALDESVTTFSDAKWIFSDSKTPPDFIGAKLITLPHHWDRQGLYGSGWYQINFPMEQQNQESTWSVLLPQVIMNAQLWLNGHVIGSGGSLEAPIARHWHSPMVFNFPVSLLEKNNTLHLRVVAYTNEHAKLGKVLIGPELNIQNRYDTKYFKSVTLSIVSGIFTFLVAILLFAIWLKRKDSEYFWFALACLMWSVYSVNIFIVNIPLSEEFWEKLVFLSSGWLAVTIAFLLVRLDHKTYPRIESILLWCCCIINIVIILSPEKSMFSLFPVWLQFSFLIGCCGIGHLAWNWLSHKKRQTGVILLMIVGVAVAGLHDIAVQSGWLDLANGLWLYYSLPLFFIIMSYLLVSRFVGALEEKELLNHELESRVVAAGDLLENNYRKIILMEKQQATINERERIHRDLHDSIGAKLLSLVYRSTSESEAELARSALSDLRNLVHQVPSNAQPLLNVISEWESTFVKRCLEVEKSVSFRVYHVPNAMELAESDIHNLNALLSEALTNALKHGDFLSINVVIRYRARCLKFEITEQGEFGSSDKWIEGFGMKNMRFRVESMHGKIVWTKSEKIHRVKWIFPINGGSHA